MDPKVESSHTYMYCTNEASCYIFRSLMNQASAEVVNGQTNRGATALMLAAARGNRPLVEVMLAARRHQSILA